MRYPVLEFRATGVPFGVYNEEDEMTWLLSSLVAGHVDSELIDSDGRLYHVEDVEVLKPRNVLLRMLTRLLGGHVQVRWRLSGESQVATLDELKRRVCDTLERHETWYSSAGPVDIQQRIVRRCESYKEVIEMFS